MNHENPNHMPYAGLDLEPMKLGKLDTIVERIDFLLAVNDTSLYNRDEYIEQILLILQAIVANMMLVEAKQAIISALSKD